MPSFLLSQMQFLSQLSASSYFCQFPRAWDIQLVEKNMVSPEIQRGGELEYSIYSVSHRNESAIRHFPLIFRPAGHGDWVFKDSTSGPQPHMHLRIIKGSFEKRWHQVPFQTIKMESLRNRSQVLIFFEISNMILMKSEHREPLALTKN